MLVQSGQFEQIFGDMPPAIMIPLTVLSLVLLIGAWWHILTHKSYKRGTRALWLIVSLVTIIGPLLYFTLGRSDE